MSPQNAIEPHAANADISLGSVARRAMMLSAVVGAAGLAAAVVLGYFRGDQWRYFSHSYLVNYLFFLSISLGGLFFVAVQHATRSGWSVTVRRLAEVTAANVPLLAVLFLPILVPVFMDSDVLYPWANPETVAHSHLLQHKSPWLNPTMFGVRAVIYLSLWVLLGRFFLVRSLYQDIRGGTADTLAMERLSPVALILFALSITFAAFDWAMSLTPDWYSTIYGVYFFAGAAVAIFAWLTLAAAVLQSRGWLPHAITVEHYHDLGKLLFSFVVFWGYIGFSQYLLIWYANVPEETQYYWPRQDSPWSAVSLLLVGGNLVIPLFGLLSRHVKRNKWMLGFWAVWLLVMHWIDMYWLVMPSLSPQEPPLSAIDLCLFVGIGGVWLAGWFHLAGDRPLIPTADPRLAESLAFENV